MELQLKFLENEKKQTIDTNKKSCDVFKKQNEKLHDQLSKNREELSEVRFFCIVKPISSHYSSVKW